MGATTTSQQTTSKPSSKVSVSDTTKSERRSLSTNVKVNPSLNSLKQVQRRWLPCLLVAVVAVALLLLRQGVTPLHRMQLKRRRRNQNLDRMMIWDSDSSTKC